MDKQRIQNVVTVNQINRYRLLSAAWSKKNKEKKEVNGLDVLYSCYECQIPCALLNYEKQIYVKRNRRINVIFRNTLKLMEIVGGHWSLYSIYRSIVLFSWFV